MTTIEKNKFGTDDKSAFNMQRDGFEEGPIAEKIESQTAKLPSDLFLWAAGAAVVFSAVTQLAQPKRGFFNVPTRGGQISLFVGQWAPTLLLLGVYNKIVKVMGRSDSTSRAAA